MKNPWPTKKLGVIAVAIIFIAYAFILVGRGQFLLSALVIPALVILVHIDWLAKITFGSKNALIEVWFYKMKLATKMEVPQDQVHIERVQIGNGEVIIGISSKDRLIVRFLAHIKIAFGEQTTIELMDENQVLNNSLSVGEWMTGIFEDISDTSLKQSDISMLKVRIRSGSKEKIYGPILIP